MPASPLAAATTDLRLQHRLCDALCAYAEAEAAQVRLLASLSGLASRAALFARAAAPAQ